MTEEINDLQNNKRRISKLAVSSLVVTLASFCSAVVLTGVDACPLLCKDVFFFSSQLSAIVIGLLATIVIRRNYPNLRGNLLAISGIVAALLFVFMRIAGIMRGGPYGNEF